MWEAVEEGEEIDDNTSTMIYDDSDSRWSFHLV